MHKLDDRVEQKKVARRYRKLGYEVHEDPGPDRLPDFMQGATADLVARSPSDNVVVEIKRHASLKGSNELIDIAERVAGHPDWRFELVVLPDTRDQADEDRSFKERVGVVRAAVEHVESQPPDMVFLFSMAFMYVVGMLRQAVRDVAAKAGVAARGKDDRALLQDLAFKGVLPGAVVERCLAALMVRDNLPVADISKRDVEELLTLCEDLRSFL